MRIALVHGFYSSKTPSGENAVVRMQVDALRSAGHEVELFAAHTDDLEISALYKIRTAINVATGKGIDPSEAIKKFQPDVVHVHNLFPNFASRWLRSWEGPIIATVHNFRPLCASGNLFRSGEYCVLCPTSGQLNGVIHRCYKGSAIATVPLAVRNSRKLGDELMGRADSIIYLSHRSLSTYEEFMQNSSRSAVVPNFVRPFPQKSSGSAGGSWLYAGRLTPEKGIVRLALAWPEDTRLDVYGDGPDMERLLDVAPPSINVHGAVGRETVLEAVSNAEGVIIPSLWPEGMPTIYLEALAGGVPAISKTGNSAADDILASSSGLVFDDFAEVAECIRQINKSRGTYVKAALERYEGNFSERVWLTRMNSIYEEAVSRCSK